MVLAPRVWWKLSTKSTLKDFNYENFNTSHVHQVILKTLKKFYCRNGVLATNSIINTWRTTPKVPAPFVDNAIHSQNSISVIKFLQSFQDDVMYMRSIEIFIIEVFQSWLGSRTEVVRNASRLEIRRSASSVISPLRSSVRNRVPTLWC